MAAGGRSPLSPRVRPPAALSARAVAGRRGRIATRPRLAAAKLKDVTSRDLSGPPVTSRDLISGHVLDVTEDRYGPAGPVSPCGGGPRPKAQAPSLSACWAA